MFGEIKTLGKETLIYGISTVVARLLNFILLPLYTCYFGLTEFNDFLGGLNFFCGIR